MQINRIETCPMEKSTLKTKTVSSLFWSFLDKFGQQLIYLASGIVLMNIVPPAEYGLIGALTVFIAFSGLLIDSGFARALLNRKNITEIEYSSVFYFNIALSLVLYAILFLASPFLADIFHEPRIEPVSKVLFLSFVFTAPGLIQQTLLMKKADFKGLTKVNIAALIIAASIAIVMAIKGYGVWSLVMQNVVYGFFRTVFLWIYSKWRPIARFSIKVLRSFLGLSNKLLLSGLIGAVFNNIYPSIIAFFYPNSMNQVGYYAQANKYQDIPFSILSNTFRSVSMLILSEINQQLDRLKRVISKMMKSLAFLAFPLGLYMILAAEPAFAFLFGNKWNAAVPYFKVLCLGGMLSPYPFILNELFIAREKADFFLGVEIVKRIILVLLIFLFFKQGIMGLAVSWVIYMIITLLISLILSQKLIRYTLLDFLKDVLPYLPTAFASVALGYVACRTIQNNFLYLVVSAGIVGGSYWLMCRLLKLEMTKEIGEWFSSKKEK